MIATNVKKSKDKFKSEIRRSALVDKMITAAEFRKVYLQVVFSYFNLEPSSQPKERSWLAGFKVDEESVTEVCHLILNLKRVARVSYHYSIQFILINESEARFK